MTLPLFLSSTIDLTVAPPDTAKGQVWPVPGRIFYLLLNRREAWQGFLKVKEGSTSFHCDHVALAFGWKG